jgi:hypothetical protein
LVKGSDDQLTEQTKRRFFWRPSRYSFQLKIMSQKSFVTFVSLHKT